ncbi:MAG: GMC family oxidoreductase N-terminal domain-containing protein [Saccharofermentanales bacterium]
MKKAIIIGSGAGGATAAKELQGKYEVTVLEAGRQFNPFNTSLSVMEKLKKTGLFFDEREIRMLFPAMKIRIANGLILVNGQCLGGTTTISAGNALRMDNDLKKIGIDLEPEFDEIYREIPISDDHRAIWRETTNRLFGICEGMNLKPQPTPKMGDYKKCISCGQCVLGCKYGVKWDSRKFLDQAIGKGAKLLSGSKAERIGIENGKATGVYTKKGFQTTYHPADLVILAAGGLETPVILQNSGIECENSLFVDPVLCIAAEYKNCLQNKELSMPFVVQRDNYILSPYFDHLSFFFNKKWRYPAADIVSMMIKLKDVNCGYAHKNKINKSLTNVDKENLKNGVEDCIDILSGLGIRKEDVFLGTINAGHPGGMLPLNKASCQSFHDERLPENLYVADASLLPGSLGNPPILTIIAMAKRVSKICIS